MEGLWAEGVMAGPTQGTESPQDPGGGREPGMGAVGALVRSVVADRPLLVTLLLGEACWWTMHPASKQRSEGEKVRVGDDLILVSVSSERYLVSGRRRLLPLQGLLGLHQCSPSGSAL